MDYKEIKIDTASPKPPMASVLLIYTGGTMGMVHDEQGALVPFNFEYILEHIPSLKTFDLELKVIAFTNPIDSSNVKPDHWVSIGNIINDHRNEYDGFVILHGTDTMAYTASALSYLLHGLNKPVILTGAQLPIAAPRTDARENIITAIEIASSKEGEMPMVPEVCIYFDSFLLRGNRSKKVESVHFDAFESENYPPLAEAGITIDYNKNVINQSLEHPLDFKFKFDNRVSILKLFPGITRSMVHGILGNNEVKGIVLETYGSGNTPTDKWFLEELKEAINRDVLILNVSQCPGGKVMQGRYETSKELEQIGVLSGGDITTEAAITKLMFLLANCESYSEIEQSIVTPICGEMS